MTSEEESYEKNAKVYRDVAPYLGLGFQLAATITLFFFLGYWLDNYLDTQPLFIIILTFLGGFSSIYNFIKTVISLNKKSSDEKNI
ncbi:MAG: AtpZ/AtpI family protein [Melioribacteraceae bacterium]|nr:AtpZ/AtpI family protein [Melioribacteraceae bacterium]